jgi:D-threonate/D-erythronate kinase
MMVVFADDFSGAAEMAGIAHRYGLSVAVQRQLQARDHKDLIVIDSNTRAMSREEALQKTQQIATELVKWKPQPLLFKKVDSVMRGHIAAEAGVLQQELGYERILLLPANPSRGRKIISGHYFVNETPLDQTIFAEDPDFPASTSSVEKLITLEKTRLPYSHIQQEQALPAGSFITGDIEEPEDFSNYLKKTNENDLCCGAAEFFEAWLQHKGYSKRRKKTKTKRQHPVVLIMNGSTVKTTGEKDEMERLNIPCFSIPGSWDGSRFSLDSEEENNWYQAIVTLLQKHHIAAVYVDQPVKQTKGRSDIFSTYFVRLMQYISGFIDIGAIHFVLTGGATASAIIEHTGNEDLDVKEEVAPGIVTLGGLNKSKTFFTVKPGSYNWSKEFLEKISAKQSNNIE